MDPDDTTQPHETPQDPIEIRAENEITIPEALHLARETSLPLGLSTLQRWAKHWSQQGADARVKAILVTNRQGKIYKLDRDDFKAWLFDQKQNVRANEVSSDPARPRETSQDLRRPREISQDPVRPHKISEDPDEADRLKELQSENMDLKIDLGVRKQLLERAREEMDKLRMATNELLRENGALQFQVRQLAPPKPEPEETERGNEEQHRALNQHTARPFDPNATVA